MKNVKYINWIFIIGILFGSLSVLSAQEEDTKARARESERAKATEKSEITEDEMKARQAEMDMKHKELRQKQDQLEFMRQEAQMAKQMELKAKQAEIAAREMEYRARAMSYGDQNTSQLMLSKSYQGTDADNTGVFFVEEKVKNIKLSIDGSVKHGSITVTLLLPDGKKFKELTIDESADIRYSQSLNISDEQNMYRGSWKYRIKADKAEGSYRMSINTH